MAKVAKTFPNNPTWDTERAAMAKQIHEMNHRIQWEGKEHLEEENAYLRRELTRAREASMLGAPPLPPVNVGPMDHLLHVNETLERYLSSERADVERLKKQVAELEASREEARGALRYLVGWQRDEVKAEFKR